MSLNNAKFSKENKFIQETMSNSERISTSGNFTTNNTNTFQLPFDIATNKISSWTFTPSPHGQLVPTTTGVVLYDVMNNKVKWNVQKDGLVLESLGKYAVSTAYDETTNVFLILYAENDLGHVGANLKLLIVDAENGQATFEKTFLVTTGLFNREFKIQSVKNGLDNTNTSTYTIINPAHIVTETGHIRNKHSWIFDVKNDKSGIENLKAINFDEQRDNQNAISFIPYQFFKIEDKLYFAALKYFSDKNVYFNWYKVVEETDEKIKLRGTLPNKNSGDWSERNHWSYGWNLHANNNFVPQWLEEIRITTKNVNGEQIIYFQWLTNAVPISDNGQAAGYPGLNYIGTTQLNLNTEKLGFPDEQKVFKNIQLNDKNSPSYIDIDFQDSFFVKDKLYSYYSLFHSEQVAHGPGIAVIDFGNPDKGLKFDEQSSYRYTGNNKNNNRIKFYKISEYFPNQVPSPSGTNHRSGMPLMPTWDGENVLAWNIRTNSAINLDLTANDTNGALAYKTKLINDSLTEINVAGMETIKANQINTQTLVDKFRSELLARHFTQYKTGTTVSLRLKDDWTSSESLSRLYNGEAIFDITIDNGYDGTTLGTNAVTFQDVKFTGFKQWETTRNQTANLSVSAPLNTMNVYQVTDEQIKTELKNNVKSLFDELPIDFIETDINQTLSIEKNPVERSITVKFSLNKYIDNNHIVQNSKSQEYTVKFTGFVKTPPSNLTHTISLDMNNEFASNYYEIRNNQAILDAIKKELGNSKYALPNDFNVSDIKVLDKRNEPMGSIKFQVSIDKWITDQGVLETTPKTVDFTVTGFKKFTTDIIVNASSTLAFDDDTVSVDIFNETHANQFILKKIKDGSIITGKTSKPLTEFNVNDFTLTLGKKDLVKGTVKAIIRFKSNLLYSEGVLSTNSPNIEFTINNIGVKTTILKKTEFSASELFTWASQDTTYLDMYNKLESQGWRLSRNILEKLFDNLPENVDEGHVEVEYSSSSVNEVIKQEQGLIDLSVTISSLPSNNSEKFTFRVNQMAGMHTTIISNRVHRNTNHHATESQDFFIKNPEYLSDVVGYWGAVISNIPPNWSFYQNISGENPVADYVNGTLTFDATIKNVPTADGTHTLKERITVFGFDKKVTTIKKNVIKITGKENEILTNAEYTTSKIKQYLNDNKDELFDTLPPNYDLSADITIGTVDANQEGGYFTVDINLNNVYTESGTLLLPLRVEGWKNSTNTTRIPSQNILALDYLPSKLPDEVLKQQIIDNNIVKNLAPGVALTQADIEITNKRPSDFEGRLLLDINIINSKAQSDGNPVERVAFSNITFSGLKRLDPNTSTTKLNPDFQIKSDQIASDVSEDALKTLIINNNLFLHLADGVTLNKNDIQITAVKNDDTLGSKTITIVIVNSKAQELGNPVATKEFSGVRITGFKPLDVASTTTRLVNKPVNSGLTTTQIESNPSALKRIIIDNNMIQNLTPGEILREEDIDITIINSNAEEGSLIVTITIKNNKAQEKGRPIPTKTFSSVGLSGFKKIEVESLTTRIDLTKKFSNDTLASKITKGDLKSIIINNGLILNVTNNEALSVDDLEIDIHEANDERGTVRFDLTIKNNKAQENGKPIKTKTFTNITLSGFGTSNFTSNGVPFWLWYAVGGSIGFLLILFIIILIIVMRIKKNHKMQMKKLTTVISNNKALPGGKPLPQLQNSTPVSGVTKQPVTTPQRQVQAGQQIPSRPNANAIPPRPGTAARKPGTPPPVAVPRVQVVKPKNLAPKKR